MVFLLPSTLNYLAFQSLNFERHLMKVILSVTWWRLFWASPDEGYSERHLIKVILSVTWWRLFWASPDKGYSEGHLMKVILSITWWRLFWASPDEGYSRNVSCALNEISTFLLAYFGCSFYTFGCLAPKILKLHRIWFFNRLNLSLPDEGYSKDVSWTPNLISTF